jgi:hypothetical protein
MLVPWASILKRKNMIYSKADDTAQMSAVHEWTEYSPVRGGGMSVGCLCYVHAYEYI